MTPSPASAAAPVLVCTCAQARRLPEDELGTVLAHLLGSTRRVVVVPDLCGLAAGSEPLLHELAGTGARLDVVACRERAVRALFAAAGVTGTASCVVVHDLVDQGADAVLDALPDVERARTPAYDAALPDAEPGWVPWFPVIDRERCADCGQCASFCLFEVFSRGAHGHVTVAQPQNCKLNCPACARICPELAIIFPKHAQPPIDGAAVEDESGARRRAALQRELLLGGDLYAALAARRRRSGKPPLLDPAWREQALRERRECSAHTPPPDGDREPEQP